jgi:Ca2+ transporting ATPase
MDNAFARPVDQVLAEFQVDVGAGLTNAQVKQSREKHGRNAIPEEPPTPLWHLILEQFKDQLVLILLGSAAVSFVLAMFEEDGGWGAFVDPAVVSIPLP